MANRNDEYGREQQSSTYGRSGSGQERQQTRAQNQQNPASQQTKYQAQNPQSQNPQAPRYQGQGQGQQSQAQQQAGQQRYGAGIHEYGSDEYGSEFSERSQDWQQERGPDYASPSHASQQYGQNRQQTTGQRGQSGGQGGSDRFGAPSYGSYAETAGRQPGQGFGSSSGYGDSGMSSEYGAQTQSQPYVRPGDTQSGSRGSDMSGTSGMYGASTGRNYSGVGPKNYTRSDERITEDLCERLTQDDDIDASEIEVKAQQGVVTLEGTVEQRWMKHRAEDIAESCSGVREVENRLRVQSGMGGSLGKSTQSQSQSSSTVKSTTGSTSTPSSGNTPH